MAKPTSLDDYRRSRNKLTGQTTVAVWEEDGKICLQIGSGPTGVLTEARVEIVASFIESYLEGRRAKRGVVPIGGDR